MGSITRGGSLQGSPSGKPSTIWFTAGRLRSCVQSSLKANHAEIFAQIEAAAREKLWVAQCKAAGRGRTALRYLAAYVGSPDSAKERLQGHDKDGRLIRYRESADKTIKHEAVRTEGKRRVRY